MGDKILQEVEIVDFVRLISKQNKRFQAIYLTNLEDVLDKDSFILVRKIFLDWSNEYTRIILKNLFGSSFEGELD